MIGFVRGVIARLSGIGISRTAASLAFTSLLGLVPLATTAFAFVARVPMFDEFLRTLEGFLVRFLLPGVGQTVVRTYVVAFAEQAARLTTISILLIGVTAVLLMMDIEGEINLIFGVHRPRPLWRRLLAYIFALTLGPVLVGGSLWTLTWIVEQSVANVPRAEAMLDLVKGPMPLVLGAVVATLVYRYLPARDVHWFAAIVGGVAAGLGFEAIRAGFGWYVTNIPTYRQIYGALSVLPLFMVWLYISWMAVLAGAAIAATIDAGRRANPR
jgi:membrane protein